MNKEININEKYPILLKDQIKLLLENEAFFKTFGKYTEPYPDKLVKKIAEEYRDKPFEIHNELFNIPPSEKQFERYLTVKEMEEKMIREDIVTIAMLGCSILRKIGYPCALLIGLDPKSVFDSEKKFSGSPVNIYSVCLVKINGFWYIYDVRRGVASRFLSAGLIAFGYIPALILRDSEDVGISKKEDLYKLAINNVKHVLLLDLQKDLLSKIV